MWDSYQFSKMHILYLFYFFEVLWLIKVWLNSTLQCFSHPEAEGRTEKEKLLVIRCKTPCKITAKPHHSPSQRRHLWEAFPKPATPEQHKWTWTGPKALSARIQPRICSALIPWNTSFTNRKILSISTVHFPKFQPPTRLPRVSSRSLPILGDSSVLPQTSQCRSCSQKLPNQRAAGIIRCKHLVLCLFSMGQTEERHPVSENYMALWKKNLGLMLRLCQINFKQSYLYEEISALFFRVFF